MDRKKGVFALFVGYIWITTLAGLAFHPYKSIRGMVKDQEKKVLLPIVLTPTASIIFMLMVGRLGSYIFDLNGLRRELMAAVLGVLTVGMLMWQTLMIYLVFRFMSINIENE